MSILSDLPDGVGFYYGFAGEDHRQINVRIELGGWRAYVGGEPVGFGNSKDDAEALALEWIKTHEAQP